MAPHRVALGCWKQETNDLNPCLTTRANFENNAPILHTRAEFDALPAGKAGELGAFLDELRGWSEPAETVPLARMLAAGVGWALRGGMGWGAGVVDVCGGGGGGQRAKGWICRHLVHP